MGNWLLLIVAIAAESLTWPTLSDYKDDVLIWRVINTIHFVQYSAVMLSLSMCPTICLITIEHIQMTFILILLTYAVLNSRRQLCSAIYSICYYCIDIAIALRNQANTCFRYTLTCMLFCLLIQKNAILSFAARGYTTNVSCTLYTVQEPMLCFTNCQLLNLQSL